MNLLFSFKGRIGRQSFWLGALGVGVIWTALIGIMVTLFPPIQSVPGQSPELPPQLIAAFLICYVPMMWVSLAMSIKRGHDRGRSAWWQLLALVPIVNIWLFIDQAFMRGVDETNQWGPPAVPHEQLA